MATGTPVVGTRWGFLQEIIVDGVNGFLADNMEEWVEKLCILIKDPELRRKMGQKGLELVNKRFTYDINAPEFIRIIESVYNRKQPAVK